MNPINRVLGMVERLGAAHATAESGDEEICSRIREAPWLTTRRIQIALSHGHCPLCFWALIRSFGLTPAETSA